MSANSAGGGACSRYFFVKRPVFLSEVRRKTGLGYDLMISRLAPPSSTRDQGVQIMCAQSIAHGLGTRKSYKISRNLPAMVSEPKDLFL